MTIIQIATLARTHGIRLDGWNGASGNALEGFRDAVFGTGKGVCALTEFSRAIAVAEGRPIPSMMRPRVLLVEAGHPDAGKAYVEVPSVWFTVADWAEAERIANGS